MTGCLKWRLDVVKLNPKKVPHKQVAFSQKNKWTYKKELYIDAGPEMNISC